MLLSRLRWAGHFAWHLRGQSTFPFLPLPIVQRRQAERVRRIAAYACRTVPYYRETFRRLGLDPADFRDAGDLARLPVLEREAIQRDPEYFCSVAVRRGDLLRITSGGSCGAPRLILHDPRGVFENAAHGERERSIWTAIVGRATGYRELTVAPPHSTTLKVQQYAGNAVFIRAEWASSQYASLSIRPRRPCSISMHPSRTSCQLRLSSGDPVRTSGAHRRIVPSSGHRQLHGGQPVGAGARDDRAAIRDSGFHDLPGGRGLQDRLQRRHCGLHLNIDLYPLRVVDGADRDLPRGQSGEVIVSNLVNRGMVLLNYRLGDIVTLLPDRCECGRSLPLLSYPQGRTDDLLEFASGRIVHPQAIRSSFNEERSIWEYQVEQLTDTHFRVALLAAPSCDLQATRQRVVDKLATVLGSGVRIDVEFVDTIDRTVGGKFAPVISRRARQPGAAGR